MFGKVTITSQKTMPVYNSFEQKFLQSQK